MPKISISHQEYCNGLLEYFNNIQSGDFQAIKIEVIFKGRTEKVYADTPVLYMEVIEAIQRACEIHKKMEFEADVAGK